MKKALFLCVVAVILSALLTSCGSQKGKKLCSIEVSDAAEHIRVAVLVQQDQSDITGFFDEENWTETAEPEIEAVPQYIITLYQEKTPSVIKQENDEAYEKIMEYVTYENSKTIKISVNQDLVHSAVSDEFLSVYCVGSEKFFSNLSDLLDTSKS
ncbi:MAG: hypothetical protein K1W17_05235 [Oscillospiraceae bacterium]